MSVNERIEKERQEKTGTLDLSKCKLEEIPKEIVELKHLRTLNLYDNYLRNITRLTEMPFLESIDLSKNSIRLYLFQNSGFLPNLKRLFLNNCELENIDFLKAMTRLQNLDLSENKIVNAQPLENLTSLFALNLYRNQINELDFLKNLIRIKALDLSGNKIWNIEPLYFLWDLEILDLSHNGISIIASLEQLGNLQYLDLGGNKISDLDALSNLTKLQTLIISNNRLENIELLSDLSRVALFDQLDISFNKITDLKPILPLIKRGRPVKWTYMKEGICVQHNPLQSPPIDIVKKGNEAILDWYSS